jgi:hypothetical protein
MATAPSPNDFLAQVRLATPKDPVGLPLTMPAGMTPDEARKAIAREAMRWTYVLRSRRRWVRDSRARERYEAEARTALRAIGIGETELALLGDAERIVVRVPYPFEEMHWEARILPWEYLLAAATRERRVKLADGGRPRPLTVMRELQRQPLVATPAATAPTGPELRVLFVECLPSELRESWSLDSDRSACGAPCPVPPGTC